MKVDISEVPELQQPAIQLRILLEIKRGGDLSFAEAPRKIGSDWPGDRCIESATIPNVVFWAGMSEAATEAVSSLLEKKLIRLGPCSVLVYLIDGGLLNMPVAKRLTSNGYKKPHWAPCVMLLTDQGKAYLSAVGTGVYTG